MRLFYNIIGLLFCFVSVFFIFNLVVMALYYHYYLS